MNIKNLAPTAAIAIAGVVAVALTAVDVDPAPLAARVFVEFQPKDQKLTPEIITPVILKGYSFNQDTWQSQIDAAVKDLKSRPAGQRAICMGGWFVSPLFNTKGAGFTAPYFPRPGWPGVGILANADPVSDYERGFISATWETNRLRPLADALKQAGITLDYIYLDVENFYSYWTLDPDTRAKIIASSSARAVMPESLLDLTPNGQEPSGSLGDPTVRQYIEEFNDYGRCLCTLAMRRAIRGSGLESDTTTVVNYLAFRGAFPLYDANGWRSDSAYVPDRKTSCPSLYLDTGVFRYPPPQLSKHPLWNAFIENVNHARSCAMMGPTVPVLTTCQLTPEKAYLTGQLVGHLFRTGITTIGLFNPPECGSETLISDAVQAHIKGASTSRLSLAEIPLDADEVITGDLVTRYSDFMKIVK